MGMRLYVYIFRFYFVYSIYACMVYVYIYCYRSISRRSQSPSGILEVEGSDREILQEYCRRLQVIDYRLQITGLSIVIV